MNKDPTRRCMPLTEWPSADRAAWEAAIKPAALFDEPGLAAHWRPKSRLSVMDAYGRYLTFLDRQGWLDRELGPNDRLSPDRLKAYGEELMPQVAPATLAGRIRDLVEAFRVMTPGTSYPYLNQVRRRLKARARPTRNKRELMVPGADIFRLGLTLIDQAETGKFWSERKRAVIYRDGLMICLLICRPERRANFTGMRLGVHLNRMGDAYALGFERAETKGRKTHATAFDRVLTSYIDRYLDHYRPVLLNGLETDRVWISWLGTPMVEGSFAEMIKTRTNKAFGHKLTPHLFRDCAVTSLGNEKPELVWIGMSVLHHSDPRIAEKHYDQALADQAVLSYQDSLRRRRKTTGRRSAGVTTSTI